jgi:hypothetical protein
MIGVAQVLHLQHTVVHVLLTNILKRVGNVL